MDRLILLEDMISKEFRDLSRFALTKKQEYTNATPFPSIVIKNFFDHDFLTKVLNDFPNLETLGESQKYVNKNEIKYANNKYKNFPNSIKNFIDNLNSEDFLNFVQKITSIKEKLVADKELNGGGLHEIKKGGVLKVHTDFNRHPKLDLDRRINILIYLNKNWKKNFGGDLELWDKEMKFCEKKVSPTFNTMVIFSTNDFSNHGHPDPVNCPDEISRKSIALYYFSNGRPKEELNLANIKNRTYFKNRNELNPETENDNQKFKNYIRKFKFYKIMKNFEKKYIRKKKFK